MMKAVWSGTKLQLSYFQKVRNDMFCSRVCVVWQDLCFASKTLCLKCSGQVFVEQSPTTRFSFYICGRLASGSALCHEIAVHFPGYWMCDRGLTEFPLEDLCEASYCEDETDTSFCECGRGKWKCPVDCKCIDDHHVCDRNVDGCHCVQCSDEDDAFCNNVWQCPPGSFNVSGIYVVNVVFAPQTKYLSILPEESHTFCRKVSS